MPSRTRSAKTARTRRVDDTVSITSAARPHSEDVRGRERRYIISMGIRTLCFLIALASLHHWFVWIFLAAAIFLPYVAVVIANGGSSPDPVRDHHPFDPDVRALGPGTGSTRLDG